MQKYVKKEICSLATCSDNIVHISRVTCAHTISQMICSGGISNRNGKITAITRISANFKLLKYRSHSASTFLIQQVPFYGLYFDEQVPSLQIRIIVLFSTDLQTPFTVLPGFPATLPVFHPPHTHTHTHTPTPTPTPTPTNKCRWVSTSLKNVFWSLNEQDKFSSDLCNN